MDAAGRLTAEVATTVFGAVMGATAAPAVKQAIKPRPTFAPRSTPSTFNKDSFAMANVAKMKSEMNKAVDGIKASAAAHDAPGMHRNGFAALAALKTLMADGISSPNSVASTVSAKIAARAVSEIKVVNENATITRMSPHLAGQFDRFDESIKLALQMRQEQARAMKVGPSSAYH